MRNRVSAGRKEICCLRRNVMTRTNRVVHGGMQVPHRLDRSAQQRFHLPNGLVEAHQNRSGYDAVADVVFDDFWNVSQQCHVAIVQAVSGIDAHSEFVGELRGLGDGLDFSVCFLRAPGICIAACMEFDEIC